MTRNYNNKLRAVLFAALMVLWVFAGTVAFAGGAAAVSVSDAQADDFRAGTSTTQSTNVTLTSTDQENVTLDVSDLPSDVTVNSVTRTSGPTVNGITRSGDVFDINVTGNDGNLVLSVDYDASNLDTAVSGVSYEYSNTSTNDTTATFDILPPTNDGSELPDYADESWATGDIRYIGQQLAFFPDLGSNENSYRIHSIDYEAAQPIRPGTPLTVRDDGSVRIRTSNREGDYVISEDDGSDRRQVLTNSDGTESSLSANDTSGEVDGSAVVTIQSQDLSISAVDEDEDELDEVRLDEEFNILTISNRNGFTVEVTSDDLTQDEIVDLLDSSEELDLGAGDIKEGDDDEVIVDGFNGDYTLHNLSFGEDGADLSQGNYTLNFDVEDTAASDEFTLDVTDESDAEASFDQGVYPGVRGDVAQVSLTTDETVDAVNITVGNADEQGYESYFVAEPNDDNEIRFNINTYQAGRLGDTAEGEVITMIDGSMRGGVTNVDRVTRVLESGTYDVSIDSVPTAGGNAEELDLATLELQERNTGNITVHRAPAGSGTYNDLTDTEENDVTESTVPSGILEATEDGSLTETDEFAVDYDEDDESTVRGDVLVYEIDVSGVFGAYAAGETPAEFEIEQEDAGLNVDESEVNFSAGASTSATAIFDNSNQTVYIVTNPETWEFVNGEDVTSLDEATNFNATFNVTGDYLNKFDRDTLESGDDDEEAYGEVELVDRKATFDTVNDEVRVQSAADQVISGTTNVAPGTELRVRARAASDETDQAFLKTNETEVNEDGTFEATFSDEDSFENVEVGTNFTSSIPQQSFEDDAETDSRVVEGDYAEVEITNQTTDGTTVTVDRVYVPDGGFVTIHDGTLLDGATFDSVRGTSDYLESGESTDVEVSLDTPYEGDNGTVIAMPHMDSNDNEAYDFVTSEGSDDGPYTNAEGEAVTDAASLTVDTSTPTPTATATATPEPTATATDEATATETASEDQPGFGAVIALIALLGAALLAARRNAF